MSNHVRLTLPPFGNSTPSYTECHCCDYCMWDCYKKNGVYYYYYSSTSIVVITHIPNARSE